MTFLYSRMMETPKVKKAEQLVFQKFIRHLQNGVIQNMERFFRWYGEMVASHPWAAIIACVSLTVLGGLGLLNFYEEGDAASLVIPTHSQFRKNIDWLDENFPREIRVHSVVYEAENVLTPAVIRTIYNQRRKMDELRVADKTFGDLCVRVPIVKFPEDGFKNVKTEGKTTEKVEDWGEEFEAFEKEFEESEGKSIFSISGPLGGLVGSLLPDQKIDLNLLQKWSDEYYPSPYCDVVEATETACYELNIVEFWGDQGEYNDISELRMQALTEKDILEKINNYNISQIFLKEKPFKDLLGDVRYDEKGQIVGAGAIEMKFYTTVNVTNVKEFGTVSRGEKIDRIAYDMEGKLIELLTNRYHHHDHYN